MVSGRAILIWVTVILWLAGYFTLPEVSAQRIVIEDYFADERAFIVRQGVRRVLDGHLILEDAWLEYKYNYTLYLRNYTKYGWTPPATIVISLFYTTNDACNWSLTFGGLYLDGKELKFIVSCTGNNAVQAMVSIGNQVLVERPISYCEITYLGPLGISAYDGDEGFVPFLLTYIYMTYDYGSDRSLVSVYICQDFYNPEYLPIGVIGVKPYLYVDGYVAVLSDFSYYYVEADLNKDIFYNQCFAPGTPGRAGTCVVQPGSGYEFTDFTARTLIPLLWLAILLMIVAAIISLLPHGLPWGPRPPIQG